MFLSPNSVVYYNFMFICIKQDYLSSTVQGPFFRTNAALNVPGTFLMGANKQKIVILGYLRKETQKTPTERTHVDVVKGDRGKIKLLTILNKIYLSRENNKK